MARSLSLPSREDLFSKLTSMGDVDQIMNAMSDRIQKTGIDPARAPRPHGALRVKWFAKQDLNAEGGLFNQRALQSRRLSLKTVHSNNLERDAAHHACRSAVR